MTDCTYVEFVAQAEANFEGLGHQSLTSHKRLADSHRSFQDGTTRRATNRIGTAGHCVLNLPGKSRARSSGRIALLTIMKSVTALLLCLIRVLVAVDDPLVGIPAQTRFPGLLLEMSRLYNPGTCPSSYGLNVSYNIVNALVTVLAFLECDGQSFTINGTGLELDVRFPLETYNYTAIDLQSLTACGRTGGCFQVDYVGDKGAIPTAYTCSADVQRSSGAPTIGCSSCVVCEGVFTIQMTIDCNNVDSTYTTGDCVVPFSSNSSVMGVTLPIGGGGGSSAAPQQWPSGLGLAAGAVLMSYLCWM